MKAPELDKDFDIAVGDSVERTDVPQHGSYRVTAVNRRLPYFNRPCIEVTRTEFVTLDDLRSGKWKILERVSREPNEEKPIFNFDPLVIEEIEERNIPWTEKLKILFEKSGITGYNVTLTNREELSEEEYAKRVFYILLEQ